MLQIVAFPVQERVSAPGPKYSRMALVPPFTVSCPAILRMTSFGDVQPCREPVSRMPMSLGMRSSHGMPVITSTASAPPTPMASIPSPPAFGVCESVPTIIPPGNA